MTKLEKLKKELSRCDSEIKKLKEKATQLQYKIELEEQREIQKLMKQHNLSLDDLASLLKK